MNHAMKLAAINFLREVLGTREYPGLEALLAKADGNLADNNNKRKAQDCDSDNGGATESAATYTKKRRPSGGERACRQKNNGACACS